MSAWSDAFLEVNYQARKFALAFDEARYSGIIRLPWTRERLRQQLAEAKARLELEMAAYRHFAAKGIAR